MVRTKLLGGETGEMHGAPEAVARPGKMMTARRRAKTWIDAAKQHIQPRGDDIGKKTAQGANARSRKPASWARCCDICPVAGRSGRGTPDITGPKARAFRLDHHSLDIVLDELPGAHILRFLLAPNDLRPWKSGKLGRECVHRERIELLHPQEIDVGDAALFALIMEVVIDLARAEDDAADLLVRHQSGLFIAPSSPRRRAGSAGTTSRSRPAYRRLGAPMTQQALGRHQYQRLAKVALDLPPQDMEIIGGRRTVCDLPIILGTALEIAFEPSRRMLRTLAIEAMRNRQTDPTCAAICARPMTGIGRTRPARHWRNRRTALPTGPGHSARPACSHIRTQAPPPPRASS